MSSYSKLYNNIWHQSHADIVVAKSKDGGGSSSIKYHVLTSTNYTVWAMTMKILLKVHKVWEVVEAEVEDNEKSNMAMRSYFSRYQRH